MHEVATQRHMECFSNREETIVWSENISENVLTCYLKNTNYCKQLVHFLLKSHGEFYQIIGGSSFQHMLQMVMKNEDSSTIYHTLAGFGDLKPTLVTAAHAQALVAMSNNQQYAHAFGPFVFDRWNISRNGALQTYYGEDVPTTFDDLKHLWMSRFSHDTLPLSYTVDLTDVECIICCEHVTHNTLIRCINCRNVFHLACYNDCKTLKKECPNCFSIKF